MKQFKVNMDMNMNNNYTMDESLNHKLTINLLERTEENNEDKINQDKKTNKWLNTFKRDKTEKPKRNTSKKTSLELCDNCPPQPFISVVALDGLNKFITM